MKLHGLGRLMTSGYCTAFLFVFLKVSFSRHYFFILLNFCKLVLLYGYVWFKSKAQFDLVYYGFVKFFR